MKMSTKGRYAVRILLTIARKQQNGPVSKKVIAEEQGISADYIEQIIVPLKNEGFVVGLRGVKGGFLMARDPADVNVRDILRVAEGGCELVDCSRCQNDKQAMCVTRPMWLEACRLLEEHFEKISIADLLEKSREMEQGAASDYTI